MKKQTIQIAVTYLSQGKAVTHTRSMQHENPQCLFDNAVADASIFALLHKGEVVISRKVNSLYINYLDLETNLIDRAYLIESAH